MTTQLSFLLHLTTARERDVVRLVLVGCGKTKAEGERPARDLYTGSLFRAARAEAEAWVAAGEADAWAIISAKHALLDPGDVTWPYEARVPRGVRGWAWGERVVDGLRYRWPGVRLALTVLAGEDYVSAVRHAAERSWTVEAPLQGLELGMRLSWFRGRRVAREAAALPKAQREKLLAREAARQRVGVVRGARTVYLGPTGVLPAYAVACPVCFATAGTGLCWRPLGGTGLRWEGMSEGEVHAERAAAATAAARVVGLTGGARP